MVLHPNENQENNENKDFSFPKISKILKVIRNVKSQKARIVLNEQRSSLFKDPTLKKSNSEIRKIAGESFTFREINIKKVGRKPKGQTVLVEIPSKCPDCETSKESVKMWRFDSELQLYFCNTCFARRVRRARMYVEDESGRMCVRCDRTRSNDWYRDKETMGDLCAACYMNSYNARTRTDRNCNECSTNVTRQWYKDKKAEGYICIACYKKRLKKGE